MDLLSRMAWLSAYLVDKDIGTHKGTHLDCIYDVDPLGFEQSISSSCNNKKIWGVGPTGGDQHSIGRWKLTNLHLRIIV